MSEPPPPPPPPQRPMEHAAPDVPPPRRSPLQAVARFLGGLIAGFVVVFIPTFFAGGSAFEGDAVPWWGWPSVGAAALACGAYAWFARRRNPLTSQGICFGVAMGLLLAGLCFANA